MRYGKYLFIKKKISDEKKFLYFYFCFLVNKFLYLNLLFRHTMPVRFLIVFFFKKKKKIVFQSSRFPFVIWVALFDHLKIANFNCTFPNDERKLQVNIQKCHLFHYIFIIIFHKQFVMSSFFLYITQSNKRVGQTKCLAERSIYKIIILL